MLCKQVLDSSQPRADNFILSQHFHWQTEWGTLPQAKAPIPSVSASSWAAHMSTGLALGQYFPQKGDFPTETFAEVQKNLELSSPLWAAEAFQAPRMGQPGKDHTGSPGPASTVSSQSSVQTTKRLQDFSTERYSCGFRRKYRWVLRIPVQKKFNLKPSFQTVKHLHCLVERTVQVIKWDC